ncbi:MAG: CinA family nicotinamide mononucleotide deamidase-related protein, partial [Schleiferiaceae bacterium]|nr:CinA family nicotinamide mononucleotide deamidase-related protein [Schleiferiaceae bacterium]
TLNDAGVDIDRVLSVRDTKSGIIEALDLIKPTTKLVLITGGLGPTRDDITKHTLNEYFGGELVFNQEAYDNVERIFKMFNREVIEVNRQQAFVPSASKMLLNEMGTAPGMLFERHGTYYISMPGVPYEMKHIVNTHILPLIKEKLNTGVVLHHTLLTQGVGESFLAEMIKDWENELHSELSLAYLPSPGMVKLRLTIKGENEERLQSILSEAVSKVKPLIEKHIYGEEGDTLEIILGKLLKDRKATLATAESCTGGNIARMITSVAGSSAYFNGSVVAYANEVKQNILGVKESDLIEYGAVSEPVVRQMAEGVKNAIGTHYAIATSGIAGPDGGTEEKPVGTIWIAVSGPKGTKAQKFSFGNNRIRNIKKTTFMGMNMLRELLL